jgi:hypothetical protein
MSFVTETIVQEVVYGWGHRSNGSHLGHRLSDGSRLSILILSALGGAAALDDTATPDRAVAWPAGGTGQSARLWRR